jgi:hypothetical protein
MWLVCGWFGSSTHHGYCWVPLSFEGSARYRSMAFRRRWEDLLRETKPSTAGGRHWLQSPDPTNSKPIISFSISRISCMFTNEDNSNSAINGHTSLVNVIYCRFFTGRRHNAIMVVASLAWRRLPLCLSSAAGKQLVSWTFSLRFKIRREDNGT